MTSTDSTSHENDVLLRHRLRRARKAVARMLRRLRRAVQAGDEHRVRGLSARLLNSYPCKLAAIDEANRIRPLEQQLPRAELFYLADRLDAWRGSREQVSMYVKPKKSGNGVRLLLSFGIENRALQIMVRWTLHAWIRARLLPQQHVLRGGRTQAITATKSMMEKGGHAYGIEIDIKNMFETINIDWLKKSLPISPAVVDAVCTAQHMNVIPVDHIALMHMHRSRLGIPQGSAVSPLLSEFVVASVLASLPPGTPFQTYVDNVVCSARKEEEMRSYQQTLERLIRTHPAGFFEVQSTEIVRLNRGLSFLGYRLTKGRRVAVVSVSDRKQDICVKKVESILQTLTLSDEDRLNKAYRFISGWIASHALWRGARRMKRELRRHALYMTPLSYRWKHGLTGFDPDGLYP